MSKPRKKQGNPDFRHQVTCPAPTSQEIESRLVEPLGTTATTKDQRFIFDSSSGALYFDRDGSDSGFTQVKFAQLDGVSSLSVSNFVVV